MPPGICHRGLDHGVEAAAQLHDGVARLDAGDDRLLRQRIGEHRHARAADVRCRAALVRARAVIVAAADRREPVARVLEHVPHREHGRREQLDAELPARGQHLDAGHLVPRRVVEVLPRAADALQAEVRRRMVDEEDAALRDDVVDDLLHRAAVVAEAMVDVARDADRVAMAGVRRDLRSARHQHGPARLARRGQRQLRHRVVVAHVEEVEVVGDRERHVVVRCRGGRRCRRSRSSERGSRPGTSACPARARPACRRPWRAPASVALSRNVKSRT